METDTSGRFQTGWKFATAIALICLVLGGGVTTYLGKLVADSVEQKHRTEVAAQLGEIDARIAGALSYSVALAGGLMSYVTTNPNLTERDFHRFAVEVIGSGPSIRSVALAPNNIIKFIYPLEGNEKVLGFDYSANKQQWAGIKQAIETRSIVMAGPINLIQGGKALVARVPIFVPDSPDNPQSARKYWGMGSMVIDQAALLGAAGIKAPDLSIDIAIRSQKSPGQPEEMIYGDPTLFELDAETRELTLPGSGHWIMAAMPEGGWHWITPELWFTLGLGYTSSLLVAILAFFLVLQIQHVRFMSYFDQLTGLPNRRMLEDRMEQLVALTDRSGIGFQVFFIELNSFKRINDTHGHTVGDQILNEVGQRLRAETRKMDTVARIGGDEFVVLTPGLMNDTDLPVFVARLSAHISEPMIVGDARIAVHASVGYATYPKDAKTLRGLFSIADTRLTEHKSKRRNLATSL